VSEDRETFDRVLELVDYELMPLQRKALLAMNDDWDPVVRAQAVIRVGLGAPDEYDEEFFELIRDAFTSKEKYVREAAIWATAYSPWPHYRPLLEAAAQHDPEESTAPTPPPEANLVTVVARASVGVPPG